ncbi:MAG TPA: hypothetical protein VMR97_07935 [Acidimicrobiales bacterium]|nr:hypothetical protein [Acidimicrobiales bacterium]
MGETWADTVKARLDALIKEGEGHVGELQQLASDVAAGAQALAPVIDMVPGGAAFEAVVAEVMRQLEPVVRQAASAVVAATAQVAPAVAPAAASAPAPAGSETVRPLRVAGVGPDTSSAAPEQPPAAT